MAKEKKEKPLKKESLIIKFEHLNPALQQIIGKIRFKRPSGESPIKNIRNLRAMYEGLSLIVLLALADNIRRKEPVPIRLQVSVLASIGGRTAIAKWIQLEHTTLVKTMKDFGILKPGRIESKYPEGWLNPSIVAKTHPVFYVKGNGDLIFPRMTRTEYARYVFQKRFPGKLGLNPWRWRAYLEPPEKPEKVSDLVNAKIKEWLAVARRPRLKPAFGIVTATKKAQTRRKKHTRRRL